MLAQALGELSAKLWSEELSDGDVATIAAALGRVVSASPDGVQSEVEVSTLERFNAAVTDTTQAITRLSDLKRLDLLVGGGVIRPASIQAAEVPNLVHTLQLDLPEQVPTAEMVEYVRYSLSRIENSWGGHDQLPMPPELGDALDNNQWVPNPIRTMARLSSQRRLDRLDAETPSLDEISVLIEQYPEEAIGLAVAWLRTRRPSPDAINHLVEQMQTYNLWLDTEFCAALNESCLHFNAEQLTTLWDGLVASRFNVPPRLVDAARLAALNEETAVDLFVRKMGQARNNGERHEVLTLAANRLINTRSARSRYVSELIVPLFGLGNQATIEALDAIRAFGKPFPANVRRPLLDALGPAISGNERLTGKATDILGSLGFATKGKGLFGLSGRTIKNWTSL